MASSRTAISISVDQILEAADRVGRLGATELTQASVQTLNTVAQRTYDLARQRITAGINLSDDYLRTRMDVEPATAGKLQATITAHGSKADMTRLIRYDGQMTIVARKTSRRTRGSGKLGLPAGAKQGGATVQVRLGDTKDVQGGFVLPLRNGSQDGQLFGVFKRKNGKMVHLYGPAVYQLFRYQANQIGDEVADDIEVTLLQYVDKKTQEALG